MPITEKQKRWLKKQVHHLKPVVTVGQAGVTEPVLAELEIALNHHELVKVKINAGDREERDAADGRSALAPGPRQEGAEGHDQRQGDERDAFGLGHRGSFRGGAGVLRPRPNTVPQDRLKLKSLNQ